MTRPLPAAALTQLSGQVVRLITFVSLAFDSGTQYVHDNLGRYTWGGHDWDGLGDFAGVDLLEESDDSTPQAVVLRLSGLNTDLMTEAMGNDYHLRAVRIYVGVLDGTNQLDGTPSLMWKGKADTIDIVVGAENTIRLTCESDLAALDRANGTLFTDAAHRKDHPTDTFFSYLAAMQTLRLIWGETRAGQTGTAVNQIRTPIQNSRGPQ